MSFQSLVHRVASAIASSSIEGQEVSGFQLAVESLGTETWRERAQAELLRRQTAFLETCTLDELAILASDSLEMDKALDHALEQLRK